MRNNAVSDFAETSVLLTAEGRLAIAADALARAGKTRNEERRKGLCEQAIRHLRAVLQS